MIGDVFDRLIALLAVAGYVVAWVCLVVGEYGWALGIAATAAFVWFMRFSDG